MRIFAISDIHVDFKENRAWLLNLSQYDYRDDILILAGDVTDIPDLLIEAFDALQKRFLMVLYIPGNHDLWVNRNNGKNSLERFNLINDIARDCGIITGPIDYGSLSIIPLYGWYDYSFGQPGEEIRHLWADYSACRWPENLTQEDITEYFISMNTDVLHIKNQTIISFSHFLPRIDLMPEIIPRSKRIVYPVLGTTLLDQQIRQLGSNIHVYGHSHVNMRVTKDDILYINNAFGYPNETRIAAKELLCIYEM